MMYSSFLFFSFVFFGVKLKGRGTGINLFNKKFIIKKKNSIEVIICTVVLWFFLEPIKYKLVPKPKKEKKKKIEVYYI